MSGQDTIDITAVVHPDFSDSPIAHALGLDRRETEIPGSGASETGEAARVEPADRLGTEPDAGTVKKLIGHEWHRLIQTGDRVAAWTYLQQSLMEYMYLLVPREVSMKDLISTCTGIEEMLEGRTGDKGKSPAEMMSTFLNAE